MLKRMLHAANQVVVHDETHTGTRALTIEGTVNDAVDMLAVNGDSWQLVQEQGKNLFDPEKYVEIALAANNGCEVVEFDGRRCLHIPKLLHTPNNPIFSDFLLGNKYTLKYDIYIKTFSNRSSNGFAFCFMNGSIEYVLANSSEKTDVWISKNGTVESSQENPVISLYPTYGGSTDCYIDLDSIQLEIGSTATDYEPFKPTVPSPEYPSEIVSIEGEMVSSGWNIADITAFSATGSGNAELTNAYGTEISTTKPTSKLIVTQTPNNNYVPSSFNNGYFTIRLKNKMIKNKKYIVSCVIDITANPFNVKNVVFIPNGTGIQQHIKLQENGKCRGIVTWNEYVGRNYLEIRCQGMSFTISNIQITEESQERPYDRHRGNSITLPVLRGLPDGTADVLYVDRRNKRAWVKRYVGEIASYNGEVVGDVYMSSTGELSDGATVIYPLAESVIEELEYSDYLLETAQWETTLTIPELDEHLNPEIGVTCKILGR